VKDSKNTLSGGPGYEGWMGGRGRIDNLGRPRSRPGGVKGTWNYYSSDGRIESIYISTRLSL